MLFFFCPEFSFLFCPNVVFFVPRVCFVCPVCRFLFCPECMFFLSRLRFFCPATALASRSSALQWGMTNSWRIFSRNGWQRSGNCGTQSPQSQSCNVRGRCSSSAQGLDVIICCARFHHDSVQDMRMGMILGCSARWKHCWGGSQEAQCRSRWHATTTLPMMGGLGLRSAVRTAPGAFWASWADALPMLQQRLPRLTGQVMHHLSHPDAFGCLGELQESVSRLDRDGFIARPCWEMLRRGARPRPPLIVEPGEWHHGGSTIRLLVPNTIFETVVLAQSCAADQAHLRSHSGPCASQVLHGAPTAAEFRVKPLLFRTLVLERLRLPLSITEARCECGGSLDFRGQHRAEHAHAQAVCVPELSPPNGPSRACVGRLVPP